MWLHLPVGRGRGVRRLKGPSRRRRRGVGESTRARLPLLSTLFSLHEGNGVGVVHQDVRMWMVVTSMTTTKRRRRWWKHGTTTTTSSSTRMPILLAPITDGMVVVVVFLLTGEQG